MRATFADARPGRRGVLFIRWRDGAEETRCTIARDPDEAQLLADRFERHVERDPEAHLTDLTRRAHEDVYLARRLDGLFEVSA